MERYLGTAVLFLASFIYGCATCKDIPTLVEHQHQQKRAMVFTISNTKAHQAIDPCPTFELESLNCNRVETVNIYRESESAVESMKAEDRPTEPEEKDDL